MLWHLAHLISSRVLDGLLIQPDWTPMDVQEGHLRFKRLWRAVDEVKSPTFAYDGFRLSVHKMLAANTSLFWHPHNWPVAVAVLGLDPYAVHFGVNGPKKVSTVVTGGHAFLYAMTKPELWHAIQPMGNVLTIMLQGPPWEKWQAPIEDAFTTPPTLTQWRAAQLYQKIWALFERVEHDQ